jgi:hypothetical protein
MDGSERFVCIHAVIVVYDGRDDKDARGRK